MCSLTNIEQPEIESFHNWLKAGAGVERSLLDYSVSKDWWINLHPARQAFIPRGRSLRFGRLLAAGTWPNVSTTD